jgi:hypothetical protein
MLRNVGMPAIMWQPDIHRARYSYWRGINFETEHICRIESEQ